MKHGYYLNTFLHLDLRHKYYYSHHGKMARPVPKSKEEELEENIRQSINFAKDVFDIATNKKYVESTTAKTRYEELCKRYPEFTKAYPVCVNHIANGRYNERAFRRFLNRQRDNPGKGMEGFIERQCDYAKYLYEEEARAKGHIDKKKANMIWQLQHRDLKKWMKDIQKDEEEMKNQFEDEQKSHLDQKRREFLDFLNAEAPPDPTPVMPSLEGYEEPENTEGMAKVSDVAPTVAEVDVSNMSFEELRDFYRDLDKYYGELIDGITQMNDRIHGMEQLHEIQRLEREEYERDVAPEPVKPKAKPSPKPIVDRAARAEARRKADAEIEALIRQNGLTEKPRTQRRAQRV